MHWFDLPKGQWRNDSTLFWRERDSQRQKAYNAEELYKTTCKILTEQTGINATTKYTEERIENLDDIQKFVDNICKYKWFTRRWGQQCVTIKRNPGNGSASCSGNILNLPVWSRTKIIILHELAHAVTLPSTGGGHGRFWAKSYLELIEHVFGRNQMKLLKKCFKENKVKYNPKRVLSEKTRKAAAERFIKNVLKK